MSRRYALLALLVAMTALLAICGAVIAYHLYWRPSPVSPPPTQFGAVPEFDHELTDLDQQWTLLFSQDGRIISTDVLGQHRKVVFDLLSATGDPNSELMEHAAISPSGLRIAVNVVSPPNSTAPIATRRVLVVETQDGSILEVPIPNDDFELDWGYASAPSWLTDDIFVIKTLRFTGADSSSEQDRFLLYNVNDLSHPTPFDLSPCRWSTVLNQPTYALLLGSDCAPTDHQSIWAIDTRGMRPASPRETLVFSKGYWEAKYGPDNPYHHPSGLFPPIATEPVAPGVDVPGKFYANNWSRRYLYLGDRLIRISDGPIAFQAPWQDGLRLFIWAEGEHTYATDTEGHYRELYPGSYIGRIPHRP